MNTADGFSPNVKKDRKKFGLRKKKSGKGSSVDLSAAGSSPNKPSLENNESSSPLSVCTINTTHLHVVYICTCVLKINCYTVTLDKNECNCMNCYHHSL